MTLIKSISGIRGTIGGSPGKGLTPLDIVRFTAAYCTWIKENSKNNKLKIVVGRDARISGEMVSSLVIGTLTGMGADVINIGMATTPTTELAVDNEKANGGIILTASHNPKQWNALKLLDSKGEFLDDKAGKEVLNIAESENFSFANIDNLGREESKDYTDFHIQHVINLDLVDIDVIRAAKFRVAIDAVNSVGGLVIPPLLEALGVSKVININCEANGHFAHNPEPLPKNLITTSKTVYEKNADVGFVVDPDVDRLAIINEDGTMFNEEYTLVAIADYILSNTPGGGNTVSNLSSSRALKDITEQHGGNYTPSAVGEVNVVSVMKKTKAVIGGEGNGGIIYPASHYGRDSLVGIGLFLTHLAKSNCTCSGLRKKYPSYHISKNKIELTSGIDIDTIIKKLEHRYKNEKTNSIDGLKIDFEKKWVHLRKSNTEPVIRIYSEGETIEEAGSLANRIIEDINTIINK